MGVGVGVLVGVGVGVLVGVGVGVGVGGVTQPQVFCIHVNCQSSNSSPP